MAKKTVYAILVHFDNYRYEVTGEAFTREDAAEKRVRELICGHMVECASPEELEAALDDRDGDVPADPHKLQAVLLEFGDIDGYAGSVNDSGLLYSIKPLTIEG